MIDFNRYDSFKYNSFCCSELRFVIRLRKNHFMLAGNYTTSLPFANDLHKERCY